MLTIPEHTDDKLVLADYDHGHLTIELNDYAIACEHLADPERAENNCTTDATYCLTIVDDVETILYPDIYALCRLHAADMAGTFLINQLRETI